MVEARSIIVAAQRGGHSAADLRVHRRFRLLRVEAGVQIEIDLSQSAPPPTTGLAHGEKISNEARARGSDLRAQLDAMERIALRGTRCGCLEPYMHVELALVFRAPRRL